MQGTSDFGGVTSAHVTVLVDNRADLIVKSTDTVKYWTDGPLLAEHGFAALVHLLDTDTRILWDTGSTAKALLENTRRMGVDLSVVDTIVLSHGHSDHTGAVTEVLQAMTQLRKPREWPSPLDLGAVDAWTRERRVPLVAHPAAFREGWYLDEQNRWSGPLLALPRAMWEALGAQVVCSDEPYQLAPGCWTTGYVPRKSFETSGRSSRYFYRDGDRLIRNDTDDDQALVLNLGSRGLVIVSGCAHAGIVNTVNHAREISGVDRIHGVIGGFHLARAEADEVDQTVAAIRRWDPALISPSHCTGFGPICRFAAEMPDAFVPGVVGVTYRF